ncbi:FAD-binding oxidoreductase [Gaiella sp.]|uniref:NAD(P)/FAD-dependent oxidoreductase n=1 Tax=Gaiella sp. TaxID=2663207 RepID=UPI0032665E62
MDDHARYRQRSLWLDGALAEFTPRPQLTGDVDVDVAVVGGGYTGLWTAYALAIRDPGIRIAVVEAETVGYGASGRNGGFVSAGIAGEARVYERSHGKDGIVRAERAMIDGVGWIGDVVASEAIDCGWTRGGAYRVATSVPQLARAKAGIEAKRARGYTADDAWFVTAAEIDAEVRVAGVLGGTYTPHCARVDPARLARGLAEACERRGVVIFEQSPVTSIAAETVRCGRGSMRADIVVRATEAFTTRLPGESRSYLPIASHMLATEPLSQEAWDEIGWRGCAPVADQSYQFVYAQRTPDGRIALGGRGLTYRRGGAIREQDELQPAIHARLEQALRRLFPAASGAAISHRWGCYFAAPRDWSMGVDFDRASGLARAGGYSGHGVVASSLAGRTLADLVTGTESELTGLPWVGHRSRRWEAEPLRFVATRTIAAVAASADAAEDRTNRTAQRIRFVRRWLPGR